MTTWTSLSVLLLRPKAIEIRCASPPKRPPQPTAVCASAHAVSELSLLRRAVSAAVTSGKRVRMFESSCGVSMEMSSIHVEKDTSQLASVGESDSTLPDMRQVSRDDVKNEERVEKANESGRSHILCCPFHSPDFISPSRLSGPPELTLPTGSRSEYWRNEQLNRAGDIEGHPGPNRALSSRRRRVPGYTAHHCATRWRGRFRV